MVCVTGGGRATDADSDADTPQSLSAMADNTVYSPGIPLVTSHPPDPVTGISPVNSTLNGTDSDEHGVVIGVGTVIIGVTLSIIIMMTLLGNGLVVAAVMNFRRLRSVTNYFVVSLAVADLTVATLVMPYALVYELNGSWRFGWIFCYFWISCDVTCCTASILHLCVISMDRYLAITQPLTYKCRMSRRRALFIIAGVWICSGAISFLPIYLGWFADHDMMVLYTDSPECGLYVNKVYAVISSMTSFYIPLLVMIFSYLRIFRIASKQAKEIKKQEESIPFGLQNNGNSKDSNLYRRSKKFRRDVKAIKTLGTLMGLFCVCWLPFFLTYLILPFCPSCHVPPLLVSLITWLGYANSSINPCVYAFLNRDFRSAYKKILSCARPRLWFVGTRQGTGRGGTSRVTRRKEETSLDVFDYTTNDNADQDRIHRTHTGFRINYSSSTLSEQNGFAKSDSEQWRAANLLD